MRKRITRGTILLAFLLALGLLSAGPLHAQLVSSGVVTNRLDRLRSKDSEREAELKKMFQEAGCSSIDEQPVRPHDPPNVICTLPGATDELIIVGAHLDHVSRGSGAVDDWSGASLLPSLFESLKNSSRKHTFLFIGFTDEEQGLVGSNFYVKHTPKDRLSRIKAMVNLECLGLTSTKVWSSVANPELLSDLAAVARSLVTELQRVDVEKIGNDDTQAFRNRKLPVITVHSLLPETLRILHSPQDQLSAIHPDDLYNSYRLVAQYLAFIDSNLN